jgi:import inner membrane translocase subunit TIM44
MYRVTSKYCLRGARAVATPKELSALGKSFTYSEGFVQQSQVASIVRVQQYSADPNKRPSFIGNLLDNLKQEYTKSKDMQDSLKKFREEAKRLEESDALKDARRKFQNIEGETSKGGSVLKDQLSGLADKVKDTEALKKAEEALKKASELGGKLGESTEGARQKNWISCRVYQQIRSFPDSLRYSLHFEGGDSEPFSRRKSVQTSQGAQDA